ncbi:leucine zipper domain-containing protein [Streptomyces xantholiticus]|uniref:Leucine zipper domain-containing protein n=1 Tax=Streptomyces xantholiticus TaxID=68285 RepID=A0ABV1V5W9_9ACTN
MTRRNAPLSITGGRLLVERRRTRPIAHVAAERGISRACTSKWVSRCRRFGEIGLLERSPTSCRRPGGGRRQGVRRGRLPRRGHGGRSRGSSREPARCRLRRR